MGSVVDITLNFTHEEALIFRKILETMVLNRVVDRRMLLLQRQGRISFCLSAEGEEAVSVGTAAALSQKDWIFPQYRENGTLFWRGYPLSSYLNQMFGNREDPCLGRQMPNHFGSKEHSVFHVSSPIASQIPQAVGAALACKWEKNGEIAVTFFGDGATSEGAFLESLNMAAVLEVPLLFICRNNGWAISTPKEKQYKGSLTERAQGFGITSLSIDGNDPVMVYKTVKKAREEILKTNTPYFIEMHTMRLGAHSSSDDPDAYRNPLSLAQWKERCPIARLTETLGKAGILTSEEVIAYEKRLADVLEAEIQRAENTPYPSPETLQQDLYACAP